MAKRFLIWAGVLLLAAGCGKTDPSSQRTSSSKRTIGLSVLTMNNPFFIEIANHFKAEAAKHGYEVIVQDGASDVTRQQNQVKDFLAQGVSAIVLCPQDSTAIGPAIKEANDKKVPVFTADLACQATGVKVECHVATDNYAGGKMAAQAMIEALGEAGGKIAVFDFRTAESCIQRVKGFKEVINDYNAKHPQNRIAIVAELKCDGLKDLGYKAAQDTMQANADLAGIFAINDLAALGAVAALEKANKSQQVKIIGFDGQPEGKQAILEGKIYADPIQHPDEIGRKTAQMVVAYFQGESIPAELLIPTQLYRKADAEKDATLRK